MKTLRLINTLGFAAIAMLAFVSCKNGDQEFDYDGETAVYYSNQAYVRTIELGEDQEVDLTEDNAYSFSIYALQAGGYNNNNDVTVSYIIDPSMVEGKSMEFTDGSSKSITVMPSDYYTIENANQFVIKKGSRMGGPKIHLTDAFFADPKSMETTYVIPVKLTSATGVDKILSDKDSTVCAVKFVNPWHATYLRHGVDNLTFADGTTKQNVRHTQYVEKNDLQTITTSGLKQAKMIVAVADKSGVKHNVTLLLNFDDNNNCTVTTSTQGAEATGTGKFVKSCENMGGTNRNALYVDYNINVAGVGKMVTTDTLVVRNRGVVREYFTLK